jgi:magnesium transporter
MMGPSALELDTPLTELARVDYVQLFSEETVAQSVERIRKATAGDRIAYFYVTDRQDHLLGVVPARRLLIAAPETRLAEILISPAITVPETGTLHDALEILSSRKLMAVPIVDEHNHLNGVIDLEHYTRDSIDAERRENAETLFQILGVHIERERAGVWSQFRSRFPWLLCNIASGLIAAAITGVFEGTLKKMVALAFFFPVVMGIAESVSMLAVTLGVQQVHHPGHGFGREFRMGPVLGLAAGILVAAAGMVWIGSAPLAAVLCASIVLGASVGTAVGLGLPRLVHRLNLDPKIAAGPAVLAITDIVTLVLYLTLGTALVS